MQLALTFRHTHLLVAADDRATVAELTNELGGTRLFSGDLLLDPLTPLGQVLSGSTVSVDGPVTGEPTPTGLCVQVVGGPDAGPVAPLPVAGLVVGRAGDLALTDAQVSRRHLRVTPTSDGVVATDLGSANGTRIEGRPLNGPTPWPDDTVLALGETRLAITLVAAGDAALSPDDLGGLHHHRRPRLLAPTPTVTVRLPTPPSEGAARRLPLLTLLAPAALGGVMALLLGPRMLVFALLGPVVGLASWVSDRRHGRRSSRSTRHTYDAALATTQATLRAASRRETQQRRGASRSGCAGSGGRRRTAVGAAAGPPGRLHGPGRAGRRGHGQHGGGPANRRRCQCGCRAGCPTGPVRARGRRPGRHRGARGRRAH